jgi:hypothetical protein
LNTKYERVDEAFLKYSNSLSVEERILVGAKLYEAEKAILELIAPKGYSEEDVMRFVYCHLHGEECRTTFSSKEGKRMHCETLER